MKLVIGNKNYSTWSLRPWLLLSGFDIDFEEIQVSLMADGLNERLGEYSPTAKVPVLIDTDVTVSDSLAICEYVSEKYLDGRGWPEDELKRAQARALCSEIHSGFGALRSELPMNCRALRKIEISTSAQKDIARIDTVWSEYTQENENFGPWLFGNFSIADCFFAPVALRFLTYSIPLSTSSQNYANQLLHHPCIINWLVSANRETEIIEEDEAGLE